MVKEAKENVEGVMKKHTDLSNRLATERGRLQQVRWWL